MAGASPNVSATPSLLHGADRASQQVAGRVAAQDAARPNGLCLVPERQTNHDGITGEIRSHPDEAETGVLMIEHLTQVLAANPELLSWLAIVPIEHTYALVQQRVGGSGALSELEIRNRVALLGMAILWRLRVGFSDRQPLRNESARNDNYAPLPAKAHRLAR